MHLANGNSCDNASSTAAGSPLKSALATSMHQPSWQPFKRSYCKTSLNSPLTAKVLPISKRHGIERGVLPHPQTEKKGRFKSTEVSGPGLFGSLKALADVIGLASRRVLMPADRALQPIVRRLSHCPRAPHRRAVVVPRWRAWQWLLLFHNRSAG